jgi:hypothetical protein
MIYRAENPKYELFATGDEVDETPTVDDVQSFLNELKLGNRPDSADEDDMQEFDDFEAEMNWEGSTEECNPPNKKLRLDEESVPDSDPVRMTNDYC